MRRYERIGISAVAAALRVEDKTRQADREEERRASERDLQPTA